MLKTLIESKYQIEALDDQKQLLEDAKKAGMRVAGKILSSPHGKDAMKKAVMDGFQKFKKTSLPPEKKVSEQQAAKYFMEGFNEAYDLDVGDLGDN